MKVKIPRVGTLKLEFRYEFTPEEQPNDNVRYNRSPNYTNSGREHKTHITETKTTPRIIPTVLVLFIKADEASTLIDTIKSNGALYEGAETVLFVSAMKMWVGTDYQYQSSVLKQEFEREECSESFVKEYDYVAMRFELSNDYKGYNKTDDSYERNQFFTQICKDKIRLIECSKRLSFNSDSTTEVYDVY